MPDDVSCPDLPTPVLINEVVTRKLLDEVLQQRFEEQFQRLSAEIARQIGASEEKRRTERIQEYKGLVEEMRDAVRVRFEVEAKDRLDKHEARITRLEARPAKRVRKPTVRKARRPK